MGEVRTVRNHTTLMELYCNISKTTTSIEILQEIDQMT